MAHTLNYCICDHINPERSINRLTLTLYYRIIVSMIESYGNTETKRIFEDGKSKKLPKKLLTRAIQLLDIMDVVDDLSMLKMKGFPPSIRLHSLKGDMQGRYAIDIDKLSGWRITFEFNNRKFQLVKVENYH